MRNAFAREIEALADERPDIVMLSADIGNRLFDSLKAKHPSRFYNCGVAEANMIGVASGLALGGLRPVAYTIAPFITARCLEQIKIDICYFDLPVLIVGVGGGLSYAELGVTHQSVEDISQLRVFPNINIVCPSDATEVRLAIRAAVESARPTYIRLGKKNEPTVHISPPVFQIGKSIMIREGTDVCITATGNIVPNAMAAAAILEADGISARVLDFHTVKPLDTHALTEAFSGFRIVVTVEEHRLAGGFGSAVAEWLADNQRYPARLVRIGVPDVFFKEAGNQNDARVKFALSPQAIADRIAAAFHD